jgi:hypothetical protein
MKKLMEKLRILILRISFGQYNQGLFMNGKLQYSSLAGGLISLALIIGIITYSVF